MSINPLNCVLSCWSGNEDECRWCSNKLALEQKRWCSGYCLNTWRLHHRYFLARQTTLNLAKGKCFCVRTHSEPRHVLCAHCGLCESMVKLHGDMMTCDHIIPRRGDKSRFSCKHHLSNLQILCSRCHDAKSLQDEKLYGV